MAQSFDDLRRQWIEEYARDIRKNPKAYKFGVRLHPEDHARKVIEGLTRDEVRSMLRDLRAERRATA